VGRGSEQLEGNDSYDSDRQGPKGAVSTLFSGAAADIAVAEKTIASLAGYGFMSTVLDKTQHSGVMAILRRLAMLFSRSFVVGLFV
jgi:hypothetical protein